MPKTIVVVEDDSFSSLDKFLLLKGYQVWLARDYESGQALVNSHQPDIVIMDIYLPRTANSVEKKDIWGITLAMQIKEATPQIGVVFFSAYPEYGNWVIDFVKQGGRGIAYRLKGCFPEDLLQTIERVAKGHVDIDADVTNVSHLLMDSFLKRLTPEGQDVVEQAVLHLGRLTRREKEIFDLIGQGLSVKRVAELLHLSQRTIEGNVERIYDKLGLHRLREMAYLMPMVILGIVWLSAELVRNYDSKQRQAT